MLNAAACFQCLKGNCQLLGDEDDGGRLRFFGQYLETLPIPEAPAAERAVVAAQAEKTQALHGQRRARVEQFLQDIGNPPNESSSRNPMEQPWSLSPEEFGKRSKPFVRTARERPQALYEGGKFDEGVTPQTKKAALLATILKTGRFDESLESLGRMPGYMNVLKNCASMAGGTACAP